MLFFLTPIPQSAPPVLTSPTRDGPAGVSDIRRGWEWQGRLAVHAVHAQGGSECTGPETSRSDVQDTTEEAVAVLVVPCHRS